MNRRLVHTGIDMEERNGAIIMQQLQSKMRTPDFDYNFYTTHYEDLKDFGEYDAYNHWLFYGKNEVCRFCNKKNQCRGPVPGRNCYSSPLHLENLAFYLTLYPELNRKGIAEIHKHWKNNNNINDPKHLRHKIGISVSTHSNKNMAKERLKIIEETLTHLRKIVSLYPEDLVYVNIVCDSVTDEHLKMLEKFNFHIIKNPRNMGIGYTKNVGIKHMLKNNCKFCFLMDDDAIIKKDNIFVTYTNTMLKLLYHHMSVLNYCKDNGGEVITINNHEVRSCNIVSGFFLASTAYGIKRAGYFPLFKRKYGHEHGVFSTNITNKFNQKFVDIKNNEGYFGGGETAYSSMNWCDDGNGLAENDKERIKFINSEIITYSGRMFDYNYYIKKYPDLKSMSKNQAINHWLTYGEAEGRKCWSEDTPEPYVIS